jgi:hypothetical protein
VVFEFSITIPGSACSLKRMLELEKSAHNLCTSLAPEILNLFPFDRRAGHKEFVEAAEKIEEARQAVI